MERRLTEKQKRFIDFYIETGNAAEASRRAGYKAKANVIGTENLAKLSSEIQARLSEKENARIAKQDEVLKFLTSVLRGEVTEEIPILIGDGNQRLTKKEVSPKDRVKAAELLGKRYGLYVEKVQLEETPQIIDDIRGNEGST